MKNLIPRLAFGVALVVCLFLFIVLANLELRWLFLRHGKPEPEDVATRDPFYAWTAKWTSRVFRTFTWLMRVKVTTDMPPEGIDGPAIVIANHRSEFDVFMFPAMIALMGVSRMRGIVKREVGGMMLIGPAARATGCALVARGKDEKDAERVVRCALGAASDAACVAIFPEGTLYGDDRLGTPGQHRFRNLLPPRYGGMRLLRETLPEYPVVSVTIDWNGIPAGTAIPGLHCMFGGHLHITARSVAIADDEPVESWLEREWHRKDELLTHDDAPS